MDPGSWKTPRLGAVVLAIAFSFGASGMAGAAPPADAPRQALSPEVQTLTTDPPDASEEPAFSRAGAYFGVGAAFAPERFSIPGDQDDAASIAFRAGYRGYPWLAVEMIGELLTTFEGRGAVDNDVSGYLVTVNAKGVAPLGRAEPWLMLGIGFLDAAEDLRSGSRSDFALRSAAGLDLYLTPRIALYGEAVYVLPTGDVERYDFASFGGGLLFRF